MPSIKAVKNVLKQKTINYSNDTFYNSKEWRKLSKQYRIDNPLCVSCLLLDIIKPVDLVDHIKPKRLFNSLRLSNSNLQSLCNDCHNIKSKLERNYHNQLSYLNAFNAGKLSSPYINNKEEE